MPIIRTNGGWKWGDSGKVYANRDDAVKQAQAAHANGYKEEREPSHEQKMLAIAKARAKLTNKA